ncbi:MAG: hypothetical protein Q8O13_10215 [Candidatus Omnitrophota bacterium]|nr:hypothetical protein [Candidatus Omnitrophota bacterium]
MPKSLENKSKEQLLADLSAEAQKAKAEIERLKKRKKYGLVWEKVIDRISFLC